MGINVIENTTLNTGAEISEFYIGLRKRSQNHVNIEISPDSNTYTLSAIFDHHINKESKTQRKMILGYEVVTVSNVSVSSTINPITEIYTKLKTNYGTFTEDI